MSFFPRSFVSPDAATPSSFHPLFRLLDDFDNYSRITGTGSNHDQHPKQRLSFNGLKSFNPKFDVKEVGDVYELHGELPGVEQKDVEIEFTDATTLTVKGRTERSYTSSGPSQSAGAIEHAAAHTKAIDNGSSSSSSLKKAHQPTIEDENAALQTTTPADETTSNNEVATQENNDEPKEPEERYWVSERSVGEFARSFTFPVRVDQEQVKASMKNGILSVIVPKAKKQEARKITIN